MNRPLSTLALFVGAALLAAQVQPVSGQAEVRGRGFGRAVAGSNGRKAVRAEMPAEMGARNGVDAVAALGGDLGRKVRDRGEDPARYAEILAVDEALWIDSDGQALFVDVLEHEPTPADGDPTPDGPVPPGGPPPTPLAILANGLPIHHSKPGAPWTIYLDFDGAVVRSSISGWNFGLSVRSTQGFGLDEVYGVFTTDELAVISRTWGRVAEDWAPFDVDVTTEYPAALDSPDRQVSRRVLWSIVGRRPQDFGFSSSVGGISLFNLAYMEFGPQRPTFTFAFDSPDHSRIADTISQENGHMFGLLHDGVLTSSGLVSEYYTGHGSGATSWAPIMGYGEKNVTQWSRGDYAGAVNPPYAGIGSTIPQDDIAIIAAKLGLRADDHGDTVATAQPLALPTTGYLASSTDIDVFALPRATDVRIEITPFRAGELEDGGNLDVAAEIVNAAGLVVASVDDVNETAAALTAFLPAGQHYLRLRPSFNPDNYPIYGSLGQYTVTGTFTNVVRMSGFAEPLPAALMPPGRTVPVKFTLSDTVASARVQLWSDPSPLAAEVLAETACRAQQGFRQHCSLKLPRTLVPGTSYWIVAQYEDLDGHWVTAPVSPGSSTGNPLAFVTQ